MLDLNWKQAAPLLGTMAAAVWLLAAPAKSADLGGSCCADLEERVAELEASVARKGNRKVSLTISGHVNQAMLYYDHEWRGSNKRLRIIDNEASESRFKFHGSAVINETWSAGFLMEIGLAGAINDGDDVTIRQNHLWLRSKNFGTFRLGRASDATDGIMEFSLAAQPVTMFSLSPVSQQIRRDTFVEIVNPFDGGKSQLIGFQSDIFQGFTASATWSQGNDWAVALRYAGEFGDIRVAGGVGHRKSETANNRFTGGSLSVQHVPTGVFLDGGFGTSRGDQQINIAGSLAGVNFSIPVTIPDQDMDIWGFRGGISSSLGKFGKSTFFASYENLNIKGSGNPTPKRFSLGVNQAIDAAALDLYLVYQNIDLDVPGVKKIDAVIGGAKIKF
jgi:predicted porin